MLGRKRAGRETEKSTRKRMKDKLEGREGGGEDAEAKREENREGEGVCALFKSYLSFSQPGTHVLLKGAPQTPVGSWTGTGGRFA